MSSDARNLVEYPGPSEWPEFRRRLSPPSQALVLEIATRLADRVPGNIVEFGVASGHSARVLRQTLDRLQRGQIAGPRKRIFACDSFLGMPEEYENLVVGAFASERPEIRGVEIVEGYFEDTLTPALARRVGRVSLAHLDADLYSSTHCALRWLTPLLDVGSVLLFDQYLGEHGTGERLAHEHWLSETGLRTVPVAEFLRETSGQGGDRDHGSAPDRRVLFVVVGETDPAPNPVIRIGAVGRDAWRQLRRWARRGVARVVRGRGGT